MLKKVFCSMLILLAMALPTVVFADEIDAINQQIKDKQSAIEELKKQIEIYQNNIRQKQSEAISLRNELSILENQIAKTELDIKATDAEIGSKQLETREVELKILEKEDNIDKQKNKLASVLQEIHQTDEQNTLKIFLLNDSISNFFDQLEYARDLQNSLQDELLALKTQKKELLYKHDELETKQAQLVALAEELELQRTELTATNLYKNNLLTQTRNSEQKFSELYWQAKQEQQKASNEIAALEKAAREKMEARKNAEHPLTDATLAWPVPKNTITAYFHDPSYPFRYLFEHPAVDIRAGQGTPIKAPADGYVLTAKNAGMGYSYIALIHANGISTVYGHVSKIFVAVDEFVARGDTIGLTGGMPGTPGAGNLCTGPHLHFEVRLNGIPVDPLDYLP